MRYPRKYSFQPSPAAHDLYYYGALQPDTIRLIMCQVCSIRRPVAGVYCQFCLDKETESMTRDELF